MAKKKPIKKVKVRRSRKSKKQTKKKILKTLAKRGSNKIDIKITGKDPEKTAQRLIDGLPTHKIYYQISKNKPVKGKGYKEPRAVVIISTVKTESGETKTFSEISEPDFIVNTRNVKAFAKSKIEGSFSFFEEFYNEEPAKITGISIKFLY